jgi:hypothetical protein
MDSPASITSLHDQDGHINLQVKLRILLSSPTGFKPLSAGRLRRAYLHLSRSTASRRSTYIELPSAFVTDGSETPRSSTSMLALDQGGRIDQACLILLSNDATAPAIGLRNSALPGRHRAGPARGLRP